MIYSCKHIQMSFSVASIQMPHTDVYISMFNMRASNICWFSDGLPFLHRTELILTDLLTLTVHRSCRISIACVACQQRSSRTWMHGSLPSLRAIEIDELTYQISFRNKTAVFDLPCRSSGMVKADTRTPPITLRKAA